MVYGGVSIDRARVYQVNRVRQNALHEIRFPGHFSLEVANKSQLVESEKMKLNLVLGNSDLA